MGSDRCIYASTCAAPLPLLGRQILETAELEVCLVNPRYFQNVPGRKTDVSDCQWLQRLHAAGLLRGSFRPAQEVCVLRSLTRYRDRLEVAKQWTSGGRAPKSSRVRRSPSRAKAIWFLHIATSQRKDWSCRFSKIDASADGGRSPVVQGPSGGNADLL